MNIDLQNIRLCEHPVFVVGSPRSGTSVLPWALAQHGDFWTSRESDLLFNLLGKRYPGETCAHAVEVYAQASKRPEGNWFQEEGISQEAYLAYVGLGLNALYSSRSRSKRWIEQSPINTMMMKMLAAMFGGAQFLHVLRDGRAVVHSMLNFHNRLGRQTQEEMVRQTVFPTWATGPREAAQTWRFYVELALDFQAMCPDRCLIVRTEELSADATSGFRRILGFLGAEDNDAPATFYRTNRINSSFEGKAAPSPSPWNEWPMEQREIFVEEAGDLMVRLGLAVPQELAAWLQSNSSGSSGSSVPKKHEDCETSAQVLATQAPMLSATPNPVPADEETGVTTIRWDAGGMVGTVYVSIDEGPEQLFAGLAFRGQQQADWIRPNSSYQFRLYAGSSRDSVLASLLVAGANANRRSTHDSTSVA